VIGKGKRGEAARRILENISVITESLAQHAKISFGEKRYTEGLIEGLGGYFEMKQTMEHTEKRMQGLVSEMRTLMRTSVRREPTIQEDMGPPMFE
jgi:hypothetical protein